MEILSIMRKRSKSYLRLVNDDWHLLIRYTSVVPRDQENVDATAHRI